MANKNFLRYLWTSIWLGAGTLLGILFVLWFSINNSLNIGLLLLWSMAYLAIGGLLGFIFSVPKMISDNTPGNVSDTSVAMTASIKTRYQENTNLTQISDWLTKVLIGASLVELKEILKFVYHVAHAMGKGIHRPGYLTDAATITCAAIILYFITWGFISGYLVMKLVLTEQFAESVNDLRADGGA
jgi:hypothetical protein